MKYISVGSPSSDTGLRIGKYFKDYLLSFGDTTGKSVSKSKLGNNVIRRFPKGGVMAAAKMYRKMVDELIEVNKLAKKEDELIHAALEHNDEYYIKEQNNSLTENDYIMTVPKKEHYERNLYVDSGGFQVILGHFGKAREDISGIGVFIQGYHYGLRFLNDEHINAIHRIFSLDVYYHEYSQEDILHHNKQSMTLSLELLKERPIFKEKQLFIFQTTTKFNLDTWKSLFLELEIYKHYKLWSFGGLVGLKKSTNAKFLHSVPATMWLLTLQRKYNFEMKQLHFLGQGSKLNFISMGIMEKLLKWQDKEGNLNNIEFTSDSSQLVRFARIDQKLPLVHREFSENFQNLGSELRDRYHEDEEASFELIKDPSKLFETTLKHYESEDLQRIKNEFMKTKRLSNVDFSEILAHSTHADLHFGEIISKKIVDFGIDKITYDDLLELDPIMKQGRLSKELMNNIDFIKEGLVYIENVDTEGADNMMYRILSEYETYRGS